MSGVRARVTVYLGEYSKALPASVAGDVCKCRLRHEYSKPPVAGSGHQHGFQHGHFRPFPSSPVTDSLVPSVVQAGVIECKQRAARVNDKVSRNSELTPECNPAVRNGFGELSLHATLGETEIAQN